MKNILLLLTIVLTSFISYGQNQIIHHHDVMNDKDYYSLDKDLLCSTDGKKGFILDFRLAKKGDKVEYRGISIMASQIGTCHEKDILIVLFDDSTKETFEMWNDFNCNGNVYMDWNKKAITTLNKPIKAIRLTNGRSYDSFTKEFTNPAEKNFFIDAINAINNQTTIEKK